MLQWHEWRTPSLRSLEALWVLLGLLVVSIFINYIDRSNLSVAAPDLRRELSLSPSDLGLLLGAFFWSYALLQMVAGWVVDRYNVYWAYGFGFLLWSLATALTGFAGSFGVLFGLRLVLGTGESIAYPAYSRIIACDFPERHRGIANALLDAGSKAGPAIGTMLGFWIVGHFGWRPLFFMLGFGGLIWLVPWFMVSPRSGSANPAGKPAGAGPGFLDIARQRDAWGTFLVLFCSNYAWYFMLTWLPSYLVEERHFSKAMMTVYGSLPYWGITLMTHHGRLALRPPDRAGSVHHARAQRLRGGGIAADHADPAGFDDSRPGPVDGAAGRRVRLLRAVFVERMGHHADAGRARLGQVDGHAELPGQHIRGAGALRNRGDPAENRELLLRVCHGGGGAGDRGFLLHIHRGKSAADPMGAIRARPREAEQPARRNEGSQVVPPSLSRAPSGTARRQQTDVASA